MEHSHDNPLNTMVSEEEKTEAVLAVQEIMSRMVEAETKNPSYMPANCEVCKNNGDRNQTH